MKNSVLDYVNTIQTQMQSNTKIKCNRKQKQSFQSPTIVLITTDRRTKNPLDF